MIGGAGDHGGCCTGGCMGASGFGVAPVDGIVIIFFAGTTAEMVD